MFHYARRRRGFAASGGKVRTCERSRGSPGAALFTVPRKDKVRKAGWRGHWGVSWPLLRLQAGMGRRGVEPHEALALAVSPALSVCCSFTMSLSLSVCVFLSLPPSVSIFSFFLFSLSLLFPPSSPFISLSFFFFSLLSFCAFLPSSNLSSFSFLSHFSPAFVLPSSFRDHSFALYLNLFLTLTYQ